MDRKLYKLPFRKALSPKWMCPTCEKSELRVKKDTFNAVETSLSKKAHEHDDWSPDWISYVYSCLLECTNDRCRDVVANSGVGFVDLDVTFDAEGNSEQEWSDYFSPKYFQPHLKLFSFPENVPDDVVKEINQSFELFFSNPPSASNHVRIALENLLTYMKVKRYESRKGKRIFLNLHRRIELIPAQYKKLEELFFAIKWLGNAGSHSNKEITLDDVMDAYEIMEVLLQELFSKKEEQVKKIAKKIIKKKGPSGKKKV